LQLFLARLATDPATFQEYLRNPDEVVHEAGLSPLDRAALSTPVWHFLARLATDPGTLERYFSDPEEVVREAGLSPPDRAALKAMTETPVMAPPTPAAPEERHPSSAMNRPVRTGPTPSDQGEVIQVLKMAAYSLRRPVSLSVISGPSGLSVEPLAGELRGLLNGHGPTLAAAEEDIGRRFDELIRENRAIPPHARTPENERIARILGGLVDWERYERENPPKQPMWGQVREQRADGSLRIHWIIGPNELNDQEGDLRGPEVHPSLAAIPVGRWFYGVARSFPDHIEWVEDPEEVPDPRDPEARRALWESLPKVPANEPDCWPLKRS
jgi:hypothetical protein